jgi:hypothetical protein
VKGLGSGVGGDDGVSHHKTKHREEYGTTEDVMDGIVFWDENNTENPDKEHENCRERPPTRIQVMFTTLVFIENRETRHQQHTRSEKVPCFDGVDGGGALSFSAMDMKGS